MRSRTTVGALVMCAALLAGCNPDTVTIIGIREGQAYRVVIASDGHAWLLVANNVVREYRIPRGIARTFISTAAASKVDNLKAGECRQNVASPEHVWISYRGWFSADLTCHPDSMDPYVSRRAVTLNNMARTIVACSGPPATGAGKPVPSWTSC